MQILVLNGGTATVKVALVEVTAGRITVSARHTAAARDGAEPGDLFAEALERIGAGRVAIDAVGHRVVHGGTRFSAPARLDAEVEAAIAALVPLAPLHNPVALAGIRVARAHWPGVPMVAVFDTAFHAGRTPASRRYALPAELTETLGLFRYGFHGIAHASLVEGVAALEGITQREVTAVTVQLGHGCSACAVANGTSVETSMGFTPLEGLMMATRSGDLDPGLVLYLLRTGRTVDDVEELLTRRSGLLGVGGSSDLRVVLAAEAAGDPRAALAVELFVRRIVTTVGAYLTLLQGRGSLVFGGGIGEHSAEIRRRVAAGLSAWNVHIDPARNDSARYCCISTAQSRPVYVVPTDEERLIAGAAARLLGAPC